MSKKSANKKLHKSIRKYATFNPNKLDELIELDSYELIETSNDNISTNKQFQSAFKKIKPSDIKFEIYKHKHEESYLVINYSENGTSYSYFNNAILRNRIDKPAEIYVSKKSINFSYYKNGKFHNDFGPAKFMYKIKNDKFVLEFLMFLKNNHIYNKNGICWYTHKYDHKITVSFMKNDIVTSFYYTYHKAKISNIKITKKDLKSKQFQTIQHENKSDITRSYISEVNKKQHRIDGPAYIQIKDRTIYKTWMINGKKLPENIFHYKKGLENTITKADVLNAILFDRVYGSFLQEKFNGQKTA